jgi:hypothetical protein
MTRKKRILVPIWNHLLVVYDTEDFRLHLKKFGESYTKAQAWCVSHPVLDKGEERSCVHLLFNSKAKGLYKLTAGTIAHECLHATHAILSDRRVKFSAHNDEAVTYTQEWIIDKVTNFLL